jgi:hypothetical protein
MALVSGLRVERIELFPKCQEIGTGQDKGEFCLLARDRKEKDSEEVGLELRKQCASEGYAFIVEVGR